MTTPKYRKPPHPPTQADVADRARWEKLVDDSLTSVQAAAEKWRNGLAGFLTIITGGLLIKGPETASDLTLWWRVALTLFLGVGVALVIAGLWLALSAAAGSPALLNRSVIIEKYGGVRQFEVASAAKAASALRNAKAIAMAGLVLLGMAAVLSWWAQEEPPDPPAFVKVDLDSGQPPVCGKLLSGDKGELRVQVSGEKAPRTIAFSAATNLRMVATC